MTTINTSRLVLRNPQPGEARQYGTINGLQCDERGAYDEMQEWDRRGALQLFLIARDRPGSWGLAVPEGAVVGFIKITRGPPNEVSFITNLTDRGQGYMKEACTAVFTYWFQNRGGELFVETRADNAPVVRMMTRFGLDGQRGSWSPVGSVNWTFGWASWRYAG